MKKAAKQVFHALALVLAFPLAALAGFGRWETMFAFGAQSYASVPGIVGDYLRIAYYRLTLQTCSLYSRVSFGSFFAHSNVVLEQGVYIGSYCVIGSCRIGERTQIASHVQVLSGRRQHSRDTLGRISSAVEHDFEVLEIGKDCWIGAAAIVMASIGDNTTIGAGAVVVRPIEGHVVAAGNPARIISEAVSG